MTRIIKSVTNEYAKQSLEFVKTLFTEFKNKKEDIAVSREPQKK